MYILKVVNGYFDGILLKTVGRVGEEPVAKLPRVLGMTGRTSLKRMITAPKPARRPAYEIFRVY